MLKINIEKKFNLKAEDFNNPVVLIGFPGIALVGKLAITSIIDSIKAKEFLNIECFNFPAKANVEKGNLEIPNAKLYYKATENPKDNDLFILTANYQPQDPEGVYEFSERFCEELHSITDGKIQMYVSTGAMITDIVKDQPQIHICGTDQHLVKSFLKFENTKIMEGGIIAGANGILPAYAGNKGFAPGVCLLAETLPLPMMTLDPRSSKALVTLIKNYFSIDMDFSKLNEKIKEMESILDSFKKQADHFMKGRREDRGPDSYFR
jgi:proteasome assembly chaperone (PAC2) family protein